MNWLSGCNAPKYWNTHHLWCNALKFRHIQSPLDYDISKPISGGTRNGGHGFGRGN